jgi:hypothetical protein
LGPLGGFLAMAHDQGSHPAKWYAVAL